MDFKRWDKLVGWGVFAIAAATYLLTMEPSSSLWDCAEFIATAEHINVNLQGMTPEDSVILIFCDLMGKATWAM